MAQITPGGAGGGGTPKFITGADPAAGAEMTHTFAQPCILYAIGIRLVTSATAASRIPKMLIKDASGNMIGYSVNTLTQLASLTKRWAFGLGIPPLGVAGPATDNNVALWSGPIALPAGATIETVTTAIQVDDNYGAPTFSILEF